MKKLSLPFLLLAICLAWPAALAQAQEETPPKPIVAEKPVQSVFDTLMGAIEDNSYTSFLTVVDEEFKIALTKEIFASVVAQIAPRQKKGYKAVYFGSLDKLGYKVHIWKLVFEDKGDDVLAELSLKDEKVGGFFLR